MRPLHARDRGGDVEHHLVERQTIGHVPALVGLAERHHGAGRDAVVDAGENGVVAVARIAAHHALELVSEAEDLLQDDQAALARSARRSTERLEREAVGRLQRDRLFDDVGILACHGRLARSMRRST